MKAIKNTIKNQVTEYTLSQIRNKPLWLLPLYTMNNQPFGYVSYEAKISNGVLEDNGYVYCRYRDLSFTIRKKDAYLNTKSEKKIHGNAGIFVLREKL
jgi:hypothetical protein